MLGEVNGRSIKDLTEREKPLLLKSKTNIPSLECRQLERETRKYCPVAQLVEHATVNRGVEPLRDSQPPLRGYCCFASYSTRREIKWRLCGIGGMVDALDLGSSVYGVRVRVPYPVPMRR